MKEKDTKEKMGSSEKPFQFADSIEKVVAKFRLQDMPPLMAWQTNQTYQLESISKVLEVLSGYSYENAEYVLSVCLDVIKSSSELKFPRDTVISD